MPMSLLSWVRRWYRCAEASDAVVEAFGSLDELVLFPEGFLQTDEFALPFAFQERSLLAHGLYPFDVVSEVRADYSWSAFLLRRIS